VTPTPWWPMSTAASAADLPPPAGTPRHAPAVQWRRCSTSSTAPTQGERTSSGRLQHCEDRPACTCARHGHAPARGIVTIDYDLCIGCAYCDWLPYRRAQGVCARSLRRAAWRTKRCAKTRAHRRGAEMHLLRERVDEAWRAGSSGRDGATPVCVNSCIADALVFGDLEDRQSGSRLLRERTHFACTRSWAPNRASLPYDRQRRTCPRAAAEAGRRATPAHAQPRRRALPEHWNGSAANFLLGGAGSGLLAVRPQSASLRAAPRSAHALACGAR